MDSKVEVIRGNFVPVGQLIEENKEEMSSNEYVDNTAVAELNNKEAEQNKELSEEHMEETDGKDQIIAGLKEELSVMQEKMAKMETDMSTYMSENTQLKAFKASIEKQNKEFAVETTLKDVVGVLPKEELEACRMSAEQFSLDNIDVWKNEVQAKAFKFSKGIVDKKSHIQVALPIVDKPKRGTGLWD